MAGLVLEARLRSRLAELREYRRNGIRTFADADVSRVGSCSVGDDVIAEANWAAVPPAS